MISGLPSWMNFLVTAADEAAEQENPAEPAASAEAKIIDTEAIGDKARIVALYLFEDAQGSLLEASWKGSDHPIFSQMYPSMQDATTVFNQLKAELLTVQTLVHEGQLDEAENQSRALITKLEQFTDTLEHADSEPITRAELRQTHDDCTEELKIARRFGPYQLFECPVHREVSAIGILVPQVDKEAKITMQNLFFADVAELLDYQEQMKTLDPNADPDASPIDEGLAGPMMDGPNPEDGEGADPLMETPAKPSALEQMVDNKVQEQVESSLDNKAKAVFDDVHADTVKVMRRLGRSWEEIKDFFNRYLKYDWDDIDVFLEQFQMAEEGESNYDPAVEKVKQEMGQEAETAEHPAPEQLPPVSMPAASQKSKVTKSADLVRDPDSLKVGDKITLVRSIISKESRIIAPEVTGVIASINGDGIVIDSNVGTFTLARHDSPKLFKEASLKVAGKKTRYFLNPQAEYDYEADLIDEISTTHGAYKQAWDFAAGKDWEITLDPARDLPFVDLELVADSIVDNTAKHSKLGSVLISKVGEYIEIEDTQGNVYWVTPDSLT